MLTPTATALKLRPYQEECLNEITKAFQNGTTRQLVHLPTGSGKTVIFSSLIKQTGARTLVLAHTCELLSQAADKISMICPGIEVGIVNANNKQFSAPVVVSSLQSARQPENLEQLQKQGFSLLIYDECHRSGSDSARMVLDSLGFGKDTKRLLVGFTATPSRNDRRGLAEIFDSIVYTKTIKEMIKEGYLCPPKGIKIATDLDLSQVSVSNGDLSATSLSKVMDNEQINELIVNTYIEKGADRKALAFGVSIDHSVHMAEAFNAKGVSAEAVHGNMPAKEREATLQRFRDGQISVLTNCMILTEGYDEPSCDCVIVGRPTQSSGLYQQMVGRGLRLYPNKSDCLVLDFGDTAHTLCGVSALIGDAESTKQTQANEKMASLAQSLPPTINQKLRAAILAFDPLGDSFAWQKDSTTGCYQLKGSGNIVLKILPCAIDRYNVVLDKGSESTFIASNLDFEYAFATAEAFSKENRSLFVVSDLEAPWRQLPISDRQKDIFKSAGYRAGIDDLTRGQASTIISSGILNRKAARTQHQAA